MDHRAVIASLPPGDRLPAALDMLDDLTRPAPDLRPWPDVTLTPTQAAMLALLARHEGAAVPNDRILLALWGYDPPDTGLQMVKVHACLLRRRIARHATLRGHMGTLTLRLRGGVAAPWSHRREK